MVFARSYRRGRSWSASVTACLVPAPPGPAGSPCPSWGRSATSWRSATARRSRWSRSGPLGSASLPSCASKGLGATRSPETQTWSTWSALPTTVRRTRPRGARGQEADCATAPPPSRAAAAWCAAGGATTRTTTRGSASATASSTGAASSSAARAARSRRFSRANSESAERPAGFYHTFVRLHIDRELWRKTGPWSD